MTLSKKDQERYATLAALEEQPTGASTPGDSAHGADAAAIGQQPATMRASASACAGRASAISRARSIRNERMPQSGRRSLDLSSNKPETGMAITQRSRTSASSSKK